MRIASRLLVASIASLSFSGLALAQDAPAGDAPAGDGTTPAADPAAAPAATPAPDAGGGDTLAWPREIINRPLTLPKGLLQVGGDLLTSTKHFFDPAVIRVLAGYGITDDFEINFGAYQFSSKDAGKGNIGLNAGYKLLRGAAGGKLEVIARVDAGYSLGENAKGDHYLTPLGIGAHVQYNATPKIAIISGVPGASQLQIGLDTVHPITFGIPIGVGFQATPELFLEVDTKLANLVISDDSTGEKSTFIFSDTTPLSLTATYNAMPALDIYGAIAFDATPPAGGVGDTLVVGAGVRYYIGPAVKPGGAMTTPAPAAM
ncbi:MAG TPA: hypothetical protein VGM90_03160 [Kofleriaceae bacterium]|jgi:hypothetical protein